MSVIQAEEPILQLSKTTRITPRTGQFSFFVCCVYVGELDPDMMEWWMHILLKSFEIGLKARCIRHHETFITIPHPLHNSSHNDSVHFILYQISFIYAASWL